MTPASPWINIELHLVKVLHTVIAERSVSKAAWRLNTSQPVVSTQLRRLRELTGDPLLVRSGRGMVPTDVALQLLEPAHRLLQDAEALFSRPQMQAFVPARSDVILRIAASDYLDPLFLPGVVASVVAEAPGVRLEMEALTSSFDVRDKLASGDVDLVIGNWLTPPEDLHLGRLLTDEVVCLVAHDHPAVLQPRSWTADRYLQSEHIAPASMYQGARGVIDDRLAARGLSRSIRVRAAHFSLIPQMLVGTRLVLTTGRQFCARVIQDLPLHIVRCPLALPPMGYYQLWHERSHRSTAQKWLRERVRDVARELVVTPMRARTR
jgi:DNA-binding transcriptional LysR family regulator